MKNIFLVFVLGLFLNLNATSEKFIKQMNYEDNYKIALEKAKKANKPIMMVVSQVTCPWCRKLERQTLKKQKINTLIKENFIALSVDKDKLNYPNKFEVKVVPTIFFINSKDETIIKKILGYKNKKDFIEILEKVLSK